MGSQPPQKEREREREREREELNANWSGMKNTRIRSHPPNTPIYKWNMETITCSNNISSRGRTIQLPIPNPKKFEVNPKRQRRTSRRRKKRVNRKEREEHY
jgi:hypothetical protein